MRTHGHTGRQTLIYRCEDASINGVDLSETVVVVVVVIFVVIVIVIEVIVVKGRKERGC